MVESLSEEKEFREYPEIENHYNNTIKALVENYPTSELWVATEKVHGTNFCFVHDGETLTCAKRTSYLKKNDSFFNFQTIVSKHGEKVKMIFEEMRGKIENLKSIKVYGEYYGGIYPNMNTKNKPIQRTIYYTPELEFEAFDLFYEV
jgi:Rnl2 family RNA ligase